MEQPLQTTESLVTKPPYIKPPKIPCPSPPPSPGKSTTVQKLQTLNPKPGTQSRKQAALTQGFKNGDEPREVFMLVLELSGAEDLGFRA